MSMRAWLRYCICLPSNRKGTGIMKRRKLMALALCATLLTGSLAPADLASAAAAPKLNKTKITLKSGEKTTLKIKKVKVVKVTWKSSKKKVATVSKKGKVKAVSEGNARITAKVVYKVKGVKKTKKLTCKIKVNNDYQAPVPTDGPSVTNRPIASNSPANSADPDDGTARGSSNTVAKHEVPQKVAEDTLQVGDIAVRLGMTENEVKAAIKENPDRKDVNQLGVELWIYNPSADYSNYIAVGFVQQTVVEIFTISPYFNYGNQVKSHPKASELEATENCTVTKNGAKYYGIQNDEGTKPSGAVAAYEYQKEGNSDHVLAFVDYWGGNDVYGMLLLNGNCDLKDINEVTRGTFDTKVTASMEREVYDLGTAFRVFSRVQNGSPVLTRTTKANEIAAGFLKGVVDGNADFDYPTAYYKTKDASYLSLSANTTGKVADAFGILQYWIGYQGCRENLLSVPKGQNPKRFTKTGIGVLYDAEYSDKVICVQYYYSN